MAKFDLRSVTSEPSPSKLSPPATPRSKPTLRLHDSDDDLYTSPSRLETALSIAGAGPVRRLSGTLHDLPSQSAFGKAALLVSPKTASRLMPILQSSLSESEESMGEVLPVQAIEHHTESRRPLLLVPMSGRHPKFCRRLHKIRMTIWKKSRSLMAATFIIYPRVLYLRQSQYRRMRRKNDDQRSLHLLSYRFSYQIHQTALHGL